MNFVVWELGEQDETFWEHELAVDFSGGAEVASFLYFEVSFLVVDLCGAIISFGVAFGYHEILPTFVQIGLFDSFHMASFCSKDMFGAQIAAIDDPRGAHDPVGDSCEIFDEVEVAAHLLVCGTG